MQKGKKLCRIALTEDYWSTSFSGQFTLWTLLLYNYSKTAKLERITGWTSKLIRKSLSSQTII